MTKKISACTFGALLAVLLVPAGVARADQTDQDFTNFLQSHGVNVGTAAQTVKMAHVMCQDLDAGYTERYWRQMLQIQPDQTPVDLGNGLLQDGLTLAEQFLAACRNAVAGMVGDVPVNPIGAARHRVAHAARRRAPARCSHGDAVRHWHSVKSAGAWSSTGVHPYSGRPARQRRAPDPASRRLTALPVS